MIDSASNTFRQEISSLNIIRVVTYWSIFFKYFHSHAMGESNEDNIQGMEKQNLLPGGMVLSIFVMLCHVPNDITDIDGG